MKRARGSTKSRSGCQTCKDRKIKCDEQRPECEACVRNGTRCPGYVRPLKWSRKHEVHKNVPVTPPPSANHQASLSGDSSITALSEPSQGPPSPGAAATPTMADWMELNAEGYVADMAFQDAAMLMSQDLTAATLPFLSGPAMLGEEALSLPELRFDLDANDSPPDPATTAVMESMNGATSMRQFNAGTNGVSHSSRKERGASRSDAACGPRALLHTFYRLSSNNSLGKLTDHDFVQYYFKHVCRLHSCFDSEQNRFRRLASKWWSSSETVSLVIQSLAIAHIANCYPYIRQLGLSKRWQAWRSLQKDLQIVRLGHCDDKMMLCLFLLGISSSWLHETHLGLQYLHIVRNLIQVRLQGNNLSSETEDLSDFWAGSLVYWEMLVSLVDPVPITCFDGHGLPDLRSQPLTEPIIPHPWTGACTELHFVLAEVGRVLRRQRRVLPNPSSWQEEQTQLELELPWLESLEKYLLEVEIPSEDLIEDFGDPATSKADLVRTAEAFRGVGLLEIYSLCPDLLLDRINRSGDAGLILPLMVPEEHGGYARITDSCLASMAVQVVNLIAKVPLSSGACRLQPLLLVACANQLRFPSRNGAAVDSEGDERANEIEQTRYLVETWMLALSRKLPQGPILKGIDIIKEVWDKLDSGREAHWIIVMHEKGWQTILG